MLKKVTEDSLNDHIIFANIKAYSHGSGLCFVQDGKYKMSRLGKPFITLYLRDVTGAVIPGYIFDINRSPEMGIDLTEITQKIVHVEYDDNFLPPYGMSIRISKLLMVTDPDVGMLSKYIGEVSEITQKYNELMAKISEKLAVKVTVPYTICELHHPDYSNGKTGGLVEHYLDMFDILNVHAKKFSEEDQKKLFGTFLLFVYAHSNYISAAANDEADVTLIKQLTESISQYMQRLTVTVGTIEVVHMLFGYPPKDIYVRIISNVSEHLIQVNKEVNVWRTLPTTREGNAGYGVIKRYKE